MSVTCSRWWFTLVVLCATAGFGGRPCLAARIEAVAGKSYELSKQHGPWMIMAASFHTTAADGKTTEGKSPRQAADALVYELRRIGVPAYTFEMENSADLMTTTNREGLEVRKRNLRRVKSLCVLAGNYPSQDDEVCQQTLAWIKKFNPESLKEGVAFKPTAKRPSPLSGAFLCVNPLLSSEELALQAQQKDPLLRQLNSGVQHSLTENRGEYTLVIATFGGEQVTQLDPNAVLPDILADNDLNAAGLQAAELAVALRQDLDPNKEFCNVDAYVWHDHSRSIVTVGSFTSPNDPALLHYYKRFSQRRDPQTGQAAPRYLAIGGEAPKVWPFVPTPTLMRVPKMR